MAREVFQLTDLDQSTAPRWLKPGSLTGSQNTRTTKKGSRRKRRGFARTAVSTYSFPITADDTDYSPSATMQELSPGGVMFRDADDNIWARDSAGTTAYFRGHHKRCGVSVRDLGFPVHKSIKPMSLAVGTQTWHFVLSTTQTGATPGSEPTYDCWYVTVEDADGNVVRGPTKYTDGNTGVSVMNYTAVYDPSTSAVYVFSVYRTTVIRCFSILTSTGAVGKTQGAYITTAGAKWNCIDAVYNSSRSEIHTVQSSWNEADATVVRVRHSTVNTGTTPVTEGVGVNEVASAMRIDGAFLCGGVSFLQGQPFTDNKLRYTYWIKSNPNIDNVLVQYVRVTASTLAVADTRIIFTTQSTKYLLEHAGVTSGFYSSSDDTSMIFAHLQRYEVANEEVSSPTSLANAFNMTTSRIKFDNTANTILATQEDTIAGWLASKPFQGADSKWYVLTGVDSGSDGNQRAFHVRRADIGTSRSNPDSCRIVAQVFWPDASFQAHRWRGQMQASLPMNINNSWGWAPGQAAITNGARLTLGRTGETPQAHQIYSVTVDFGAAFSRGVVLYDDMTLYPGGVPTVAGPRSPAHDLVPLIFPLQAPRLTAAGAGGALSACQVTARFRFRDPSGRIYRSAAYPTPSSLSFLASGTRTLAVRALQHIGLGEAEIELWASKPGEATIHLQSIIPNDPTVREISINVDPANWRNDTESLPEDADGYLVANPPPPCRSVEVFGERAIVSGTPTEGEFLYSQPIETGYGPEFNLVALSQIWSAPGAINEIRAVDVDTMALFREQRIACIRGLGPDGRGGAYSQIFELNTGKGVRASSTRGGIAFRTPLGAVFQDAQSGRLCVVNGQQAIELPPGVEESLQAVKLVAGGVIESEGTIWFLTSSGGVTGGLFVLDLRDPEDSRGSRFGNWHFWTSTAVSESVAVGVVEKDGGPLWLQANGSWRTYRTSGNTFQDVTAASANADVLMSMTTSQLAFDGKHGECCIKRIKLLGTHLGVSTARVTVTNDAGVSEQHSVATSSPIDYVVHPGHCLRVQEFTLIVEETASSTEGFSIEAIAVEFNPRGHNKVLPATKFI